MSEDFHISRRSLLLAGSGAVLFGCSAPAGVVALDAGPLVSLALRSLATGFFIELGRIIADKVPSDIDPAVAKIHKALATEISRDPRVTVADVAKVVYLTAVSTAPGTFGVADALPQFVTAVWRQSDGTPASRTVSAIPSKPALSIPTPALLGIGQLAQKRVNAWVGKLERDGQCVSRGTLARYTGALFAPSGSTTIDTSGVELPSVTDAADYRYWTGDGGQVTIKWRPQTDPESKRQTTLDVAYAPGHGPHLGNLAGLPTEFQQGFAFGDLWATQDKNNIPSVDLGRPSGRDRPQEQPSPPQGQGVVQGRAIAKDAGGGYRTVAVSAMVTGEINGDVFIELSGRPLGDMDVSATPGLPMTLSIASGDCVTYGGAVTRTPTGLSGTLAGPAGIIDVLVQFSSIPASGNFYGLMDLVPRSFHDESSKP